MAQICYYGDKLSTNMAMTPEGFLICKNVPIARTGYQQYLESELVDDGDPRETVNVYRSPNEVFSAATLASFEGKPVTNGHPDKDVTPSNYRMYSRGHVQHVRVGRGDDADKILADLYITDPELIDEIRNNGKREVSAGYYAEDKEDSTGRICQTKIRGNHVAVVDEGRAGRSVAIRDSINPKLGENEMGKVNRKQQIANAVIKYLKDAAPEELEERMKDAAEVLSEEIEEEPEVALDSCKKDEEPEDDLRADVRELCSAVRDLIAHFSKDEEPNELKCDEDGDPVEDKCDEDGDVVKDEDADVKVDMDEDGDEADTIDIDDEDADDKVSAKDSALRRIANAVRGIKDSADRKRVQKALLAGNKSQMAGIMEVTRKNQAKRDASANKTINTEELQKIYDKLNPHKGK